MPYFQNGVRFLGALMCWTFCTVTLALGCSEAGSEVGSVPSTEAQRLQAETAPDTTLGRLDQLFAGYDPALLIPPPVDAAAAERWVDSVLASLTLDEKIGQLFVVHLPRPSLGQLLDDDALDAVEDYGVGGFLVPRLLGPKEVAAATRRLQAASDVPLFFAADYERGVGRYNNTFTELPSNMALGATRDTVLAAAAGRVTALESRAVGVNLLLAPVVDVNNNPENPIINIRSYGEDPALVSAMAAAYVREAQRYGVLTTLKHFPGHGNTSVDSHARLGTVPGDYAALDSIELRPYREVLTGPHAAAGVMSAHLWVEALDDEPVPATFSYRALTGLLRDSLGFDGFVVTDDIKMGAVTNTYDMATRMVRPLLAGADIILTPANLGRSVGVIRAAVEEGRLTEERLDASVRRILQAKTQAGLHRHAGPVVELLSALQARPYGTLLAQAVADEAVTVLQTSAVLPLREEQDITLIQIVNIEGARSIDAAKSRFAEALGADAEVRIPVQPSTRRLAAARAAADTADVVVLALYQRLRAGRGKAGLYSKQESLVRELLRGEVPVVLVTFGNPYAVTPFAEADAIVVAYEQSLETVHAAARVLTGSLAPAGALPITVAPYSFGSGRSAIVP